MIGRFRFYDSHSEYASESVHDLLVSYEIAWSETQPVCYLLHALDFRPQLLRLQRQKGLVDLSLQRILKMTRMNLKK